MSPTPRRYFPANLSPVPGGNNRQGQQTFVPLPELDGGSHRMKIKFRHLADIRPFANNLRHNDNAVDAVAACIREFGFR